MYLDLFVELFEKIPEQLETKRHKLFFCRLEIDPRQQVEDQGNKGNKRNLYKPSLLLQFRIKFTSMKPFQPLSFL